MLSRPSLWLFPFVSILSWLSTLITWNVFLSLLPTLLLLFFSVFSRCFLYEELRANNLWQIIHIRRFPLVECILWIRNFLYSRIEAIGFSWLERWDIVPAVSHIRLVSQLMQKHVFITASLTWYYAMSQRFGVEILVWVPLKLSATLA